jgi:hypothetical protein
LHPLLFLSPDNLVSIDGISSNPCQWQATKFAEALRAFYAVHSPESIPKAPALAKEYLGRERELNEALMRKYGQDLATMAAQVC